jgi:hypothetical protein
MREMKDHQRNKQRYAFDGGQQQGDPKLNFAVARQMPHLFKRRDWLAAQSMTVSVETCFVGDGVIGPSTTTRMLAGEDEK